MSKTLSFMDYDAEIDHVLFLYQLITSLLMLFHGFGYNKEWPASWFVFVLTGSAVKN